MSENIKYNRRHFLEATGLTLAASQLGMMSSTFAGTQSEKSLSDMLTSRRMENSLGEIKQIDAGLLNIGYAELGSANSRTILLIHGWPYDIHSFADVAPALAAKGYRVIMPYLRGFGSTSFLKESTFKNGQQSALAVDMIALMDALKIKSAVIAGFDWGARTANIMAALWPERCNALVSVSGYLIVNLKANQQPLPPKAEYGWWYQYYFATERGKAGYAENRNDFNKLIWKLASPKWNFDDETFSKTAASFQNPDHVAIVIHNYRWRLSLVDGERIYDELENRLDKRPVITVPTITIASDFDGAWANGAGYAGKFSGKYAHRILKDIGHNVPQEDPESFVQAILDADNY